MGKFDNNVRVGGKVRNLRFLDDGTAEFYVSILDDDKLHYTNVRCVADKDVADRIKEAGIGHGNFVRLEGSFFQDDFGHGGNFRPCVNVREIFAAEKEENFSEVVLSGTVRMVYRPSGFMINSRNSDPRRAALVSLDDGRGKIFYEVGFGKFEKELSSLTDSAAKGRRVRVMGSLLEEGLSHPDGKYRTKLTVKARDLVVFPEDWKLDKEEEEPRFEKFENFPEWAVCYLAYGDKTGLTDEDVALVYEWIEREGVADLVDTKDDRHFSSHPEFGLPGDCVSATFRLRPERSFVRERDDDDGWGY